MCTGLQCCSAAVCCRTAAVLWFSLYIYYLCLVYGLNCKMSQKFLHHQVCSVYSHRHSICTVYLHIHSIYTVSTQYQHSISTHAQYLHIICTVSAKYLHSLNGGAGCLCWPGLGGGWENSSCESSSSSAAAARERGSPSHSERPDHGPNMLSPNNRLCLVLGLHSDSIYIPTIVHRKY